MAKMGLTYDPNQAIPLPKPKKMVVEEATLIPKEPGTYTIESAETNDIFSDDFIKKEEEVPEDPVTKKYVVESLEADAHAPRQKMLRLPKGQVNFLTYLIDKYGEDYEVKRSLRKFDSEFIHLLLIFMLFTGHGEGQEESLSIDVEANTSQNQYVQENS